MVYLGEATDGRLWVNIKDWRHRENTVDDPFLVTKAIALAMLGDKRFNPRVAHDRKFDSTFNVASVFMMVGGAATAFFNQTGNALVDNISMGVAFGGLMLAAGQVIHGQPDTAPYYTYPMLSRITRAHKPPKNVNLQEVPPIVRLAKKEN
jgi:hypothetical protein